MVRLDSKFGFGKYKGLTVKDVWTGPTSNYRDVIKKYLIDFFVFIRTDYIQSSCFVIPHDYPPIAELLRDRPVYTEPLGDFDVIVSNNYLTIETNDTKRTKRINNELKKLFKGRFDIVPINKLTKGKQGKDRILSECLGITADPYYIIWCIKSVDKFSIEPEEFEKLKLLDSHILEKIELKELKTDLFEYNPIYRITQTRVTEEIEKINDLKVESIHEFKDRQYHEREGRTFGEYSGSYAQDVMGYSDEDINDIFDGDPDAYWNID